MILCALGVWGFSVSLGMRRRYEAWGRFIAALEILKAEIGYSGASLKTAFYAASKVSGLKLFKSAADKLAAMGLDSAWADAVAESGINPADAEIMLLLSSKLGKTDAEGQIKHISYILSLAETAKKEAETEYKEKGALFRRGGILTGVLIILLLF